ncbi:MAG TPA: PEP-CTERM sorting domain-containing protein [Tepidisphaeraceae bacterium]|nr:PEP-CTERM sorting domain-containing protein [Tepidisphaeraceae bacterium]
MRKLVLTLSCLICPIFTASGWASVIATPSENDAGSSAFAVSGTDLVNQGQSTLSGSATYSGFTTYAGSSPTVLNDGTAGTGAVNAAESAVTTQGTDWVLTYNLNTAANPSGFKLTEIDTVSWWNSDYVNQSYTLAYSTIDNPASFTNILGNFSLSATAGQSNVAQVALKIALTDSTGTLATGVAGLQFTFHPIANGTYGDHQGGYREVDVFGSAVPEPGSLGLLALGGMMLIRRRRNRCVP